MTTAPTTPHRLAPDHGLTDAELAAQAAARTDRLRAWLPTTVSVLALLGVALGFAVVMRTAAGFGAVLVGVL